MTRGPHRDRRGARVLRCWVAVVVSAWASSSWAASPASAARELAGAEPEAAPSVVSAPTPVILWVEGRAEVAAALGGPGALTSPPAAAVIGDVLGSGEQLEVAARGRVALLVGGDALITLEGPARCTLTAAHTLECRGGSLAREALPGFREVPGAALAWPVSEPPEALPSRPEGLTIESPPGGLIRDPRPQLRWRWSGGPARFDLELVRLDEGAEPHPVERWRGLGGRSLRLWRPLTRGARYRLHVSLAAAAALDGAAVHEVTFAVLGATEERAVSGAIDALERVQRASAHLRPELEVLRARLLERTGLLSDAERIWAGLALLHPERPEPRQRARRLHRAVHR